VGGIGREKGSNFVTMCLPHGDIVISYVLKFELNWGTPGRIEMVHTILFFHHSLKLVTGSYESFSCQRLQCNTHYITKGFC